MYIKFGNPNIVHRSQYASACCGSKYQRTWESIDSCRTPLQFGQRGYSWPRLDFKQLKNTNGLNNQQNKYFLKEFTNQ